MNTQPYLMRAWMLIAQWYSQVNLFPASRRSMMCIGLVVLACGLCLLSLYEIPAPGLSTLHTLGQSVLHLIGRIPFGEPFPP